MDPILQLLHRNAKYSPEELSELLDLDAEGIRERIAAWEKDGTILGYQAVLDSERARSSGVTALIEVRITPERGGGFDRVARRIARFDQVSSCLLMSGSYDLAVIVEGDDLREVARFVAEKLSTLDGVLSTATHFLLKAYKQNGFLAHTESVPERLPVTP